MLVARQARELRLAAASRRGPRRARPCRSACRAARASTIRSTMRSASASSDSCVLAVARRSVERARRRPRRASTRFASPAIATPYDEPARLAAHGLDDEVAAGRDRVGAQVLQLLGHDVDRGEEAEREVDAAVVVVDRLRQVDDLHAPRVLRAGASGTRRGSSRSSACRRRRSRSARRSRDRRARCRRCAAARSSSDRRGRRASRCPCPGSRARCRS